MKIGRIDIVGSNGNDGLHYDRPPCYDRPAYRDALIVQDGWTEDGRRNMVERPNRMSRECQQHSAHGEATIWGWNCDGCAHDPRGRD